jgi:hypothetical protein
LNRSYQFVKYTRFLKLAARSVISEIGVAAASDADSSRMAIFLKETMLVQLSRRVKWSGDEALIGEA